MGIKISAEIREISLKIKNESSEDEYAKLLLTIPGIGYYSALLISSENGDIGRFPDSHHLCSYAGLTPSTHSSGGVKHHGSMTKKGSKYLRWILVECARSHIRTEKESSLTKFYLHLAKKRGIFESISCFCLQASTHDLLDTEGEEAVLQLRGIECLVCFERKVSSV